MKTAAIFIGMLVVAWLSTIAMLHISPVVCIAGAGSLAFIQVCRMLDAKNTVQGLGGCLKVAGLWIPVTILNIFALGLAQNVPFMGLVYVVALAIFFTRLASGEAK